MKTKSNFEKFADALAEQSYDIIFVHPFFYVDAADKYHYLALARLDQPLTAVVMIGEDHNWHDWRDLVGKKLALPPALGTASKMVKAALADAGLKPGVDVLLQHYQTRIACLQAVVIRAADACAVPRFVLPQIASVADLRLHVMIETAPISPYVFAVHERVSAPDRAKLLACILSWAAPKPDGRCSRPAAGPVSCWRAIRSMTRSAAPARASGSSPRTETRPEPSATCPSNIVSRRPSSRSRSCSPARCSG